MRARRRNPTIDQLRETAAAKIQKFALARFMHKCGDIFYDWTAQRRAVKIQVYYRRYRAQKLLRRKKALLVLQQLEDYFADMRFDLEDGAVTVMQAAARGLIVRVEIKMLKGLRQRKANMLALRACTNMKNSWGGSKQQDAPPRMKKKTLPAKAVNRTSSRYPDRQGPIHAAR